MRSGQTPGACDGNSRGRHAGAWWLRPADRSSRQFLATLVDARVLISCRQPDAIEDQLGRFDGHMQHARGLTETTRSRRLSVVRSLLQFCVASDSDAMATPSADVLRRFIAQEHSRISPASAGSLAGALRDYLRFLTLGGGKRGLKALLPVDDQMSTIT